MSRLVIILIILIFNSCDQKNCNDTNFSKRGPNTCNKADSSICQSDSGGELKVSDSQLYTENFEYLLTQGMKAVKSNNRNSYDEVIKRFVLSSKPTLGLSISLLMANKNKYGKAYYDVFRLIKLYNKESEVIDPDYLFYLKQSKKYGYSFKKVYVADTTLHYDNL